MKYKLWMNIKLDFKMYIETCFYSLVLISRLWFQIFIAVLCKFSVLRILQVHLALSNVNVEEYKTVVAM